jgi:predicted 2-oxoglutarate/Fe(II)-dependent dioxygenase YbiX
MNPNLEENNYLHIENFISTERARALAKEFTEHCELFNMAGDEQAPNSHSTYDYIGFLELLCEKTPQISSWVGEKVIPTYTYARVYKKGSDLIKHRDRDACEISLTLHLSADAEWPIYIQKPNGEAVSLNLNSGDAMMYRGCDAYHWRDRYQGSNYVQVFLHYVKSRGERNYAYFDKTKHKNYTDLLTNDQKPQEIVNVENKSEEIKDSKLIDLDSHAYIPYPNKASQLNKFIKVYDNIIPNSLCDAIINEYKNSSWEDSLVASEVVDKKIRNLKQIGISDSGIIAQNYDVRKKLDDDMYMSAGEAIKKYNIEFPDSFIESDTGYWLLKYETGEFYTRHTDHYKKQPRTVSCSFALNDDYEGGEFSFFQKELNFKLKKGSAILFPSNFLFPHEILPVTKGRRYSIVTWFI